jgi:hypothetical protein
VAPGNDHSLKRREVVAALLAERGDALVVAGLGAPVWDCAAAGDHPLNFYLWGAMGSAVPIGLGLALARPERRVLTVTGDGELLMGLGSLATAAVQAPPNLAIVVLDNERYGETGMQRTHTALGVDLAAVAAAAGMPSGGAGPCGSRSGVPEHQGLGREGAVGAAHPRRSRAQEPLSPGAPRRRSLRLRDRAGAVSRDG